MKNSKEGFASILIMLLVVLVVGGGIVAYNTKKSDEAEITTHTFVGTDLTNTATTTIVATTTNVKVETKVSSTVSKPGAKSTDPTSGWKSITDTKLKISYKIPANWKADESGFIRGPEEGGDGSSPSISIQGKSAVTGNGKLLSLKENFDNLKMTDVTYTEINGSTAAIYGSYMKDPAHAPPWSTGQIDIEYPKPIQISDKVINVLGLYGSPSYLLKIAQTIQFNVK